MSNDKTLHTYSYCPACGSSVRASRHTYEDCISNLKWRLEDAIEDLDAANTKLQRMTEYRDEWKSWAQVFRKQRDQAYQSLIDESHDAGSRLVSEDEK